jgi:cytochrome c oxidase subunit 2
VNEPSIVETHGSEARDVAHIWWLMFALAIAVYIIVATLVILAVVRGRRRERVEDADRREDHWIWWGGIAFPAVILAVLAVVTVTTTRNLRTTERDELRVEVTGRRWFWDVRYPDSGVTTSNEIHVPTDRPLDLVLRTDDVVHSFWVPQLAGKVDMVPDHANHLRVKVLKAGVYRGFCAEYCGIQHARMDFIVIAEPRADFERWLARRASSAGAQPASELAAQGERVFMRESCAGCHTVKGTEAQGTYGPELSDIGARDWLGAITVRNTPENMRQWITDSQEIKPGNLMPRIPMSDDDVKAVVAYLEGLE